MNTATSPKNLDSALESEHRVIIQALIVGVLLPLLDATMVTVALHQIGLQFKAPLSTTQWVTTAYTLAAASIVPLSAWALNRVGGKRLWLASLSVFLFGTVLSAVAWNLGALIVGRIIQGLAAGFMMPVMQTIVIAAVGQNKAKTALGAVAVLSVMAPILGPLLGGIMLEQSGWREIFWIQVPVCLLSIYLAARRLPDEQPMREIAKFDFLGFFLLCPGMVLTIYGLSVLALEKGAASYQNVELFMIGGGLLIAFVFHARQKRALALVDLTLLRQAHFRACAWLLLLSSMVYYAGLLLLPLYFIQVGKYSMVTAGALIALHGVGTLVSRRYLAQLSTLWGDRGLAFGAIGAMLIGSGILCWPVVLENPYVLSISMVIRGAGVGVLTIQAMSLAYAGLERAQIAHASSMTRILTHLGATIGAAGAAMLMSGSILHHAGPIMSGFGGGFNMALLGMVMVSILCMAPAFRLVRK